MTVQSLFPSTNLLLDLPKRTKKKEEKQHDHQLEKQPDLKDTRMLFFLKQKRITPPVFFFYMLSFAIAIGDRPVGHIFFFYPVCHVHPLQCYCLEHLSNRQLYKLIHLPFFCEFVLQLSLVRDDW